MKRRTFVTGVLGFFFVFRGLTVKFRFSELPTVFVRKLTIEKRGSNFLKYGVIFPL